MCACACACGQLQRLPGFLPQVLKLVGVGTTEQTVRYAAAIALRNSILSNRNWARKSNELYDDSHACFPDADKLFIKAHIIEVRVCGRVCVAVCVCVCVCVGGCCAVAAEGTAMLSVTTHRHRASHMSCHVLSCPLLSALHEHLTETPHLHVG